MFFRQLSQFSERVFHLMEIDERQSPWSSGMFRQNEPSGAIIHYTGSNQAGYAVRWFMNTRYQSKASAHAVVLDHWPDVWRRLAEGLPLVQDLPTAVVQCLPPGKIAWHAGRANTHSYGLELVNAGELRKDQGRWVYWRNDWTQPWISIKQPVYLYGRHWEPYSLAQIITTVQLLRYLRQFVGTLNFTNILGHDQVTQSKIDPGPLFPMQDVRTAMLEDIDPMLYQWAERYATLGGRYMRYYRDSIALQWHEQRVGFTMDKEKAAMAWQKLKKGLRVDLQNPKKKFGAIGKAGLRILGFPTSTLINDRYTGIDQKSVINLQRLMHLVIDGVPGPKTRQALIARIGVLKYLPED